jgi:hypothetical protein
LKEREGNKIRGGRKEGKERTDNGVREKEDGW